MRKILLFILFSINFSTVAAKIGNNREYSIISVQDFDKRISNGRDAVLKRFILVPYMDRNYRDIFETNNPEATMAKFFYLLSINKRSWIERYMESVSTQHELVDLLKGLYFFSHEQYTSALSHLERVNNLEFEFLKSLLIADCKYELGVKANHGKPGVEIYQSVMDNAHNIFEKLLVNNRVKYVRYQ